MTRTPAKNFQDLVVRQKSHEFVRSVYQSTRAFPRKEVYGLTFQFRRAAISIAANIAEGFKKRSRLDKVRFMNISQGSVEECRYYLILARDLKYACEPRLMALLEEISKLLERYSAAIGH
jgi:four helix bundle protein